MIFRFLFTASRLKEEGKLVSIMKDGSMHKESATITPPPGTHPQHTLTWSTQHACPSTYTILCSCPVLCKKLQ